MNAHYPIYMSTWTPRGHSDPCNDIAEDTLHHLSPNITIEDQVKIDQSSLKKEKLAMVDFLMGKEEDLPDEFDHSHLENNGNRFDEEFKPKMEGETEAFLDTEKASLDDVYEKPIKSEDLLTQTTPFIKPLQDVDVHTEENRKDDLKETIAIQNSCYEMSSKTHILKKDDVASFLSRVTSKESPFNIQRGEGIRPRSRKQRFASPNQRNLVNGEVHPSEPLEDTVPPDELGKPKTPPEMTTDQYFDAASFHVKKLTGLLPSTSDKPSSNKFQRAQPIGTLLSHPSKPGVTTSRSSGRRRKAKSQPNSLGYTQLDGKAGSSSTNNSVATTNQHASRGKGRRRSPEKEPIACINVGPAFQASSYPVFFLETHAREHNMIHGVPAYGTPRLVYSPDLLEQYKNERLNQGESSRCIRDDIDMKMFIKNCIHHWKTGQEWQPFSPEFAFKLLHQAHYDPEKALTMLVDPSFNFKATCDPPMRPYSNKWKPKDRRGNHPSCPYPPVLHYRGNFLHRLLPDHY